MIKNENIISTNVIGKKQICVFNLIVFFVLGLFTASQDYYAADNHSYISFTKDKRKFALSEAGKSAPLVISSKDYPGVQRVIKQLQLDIEKVTDVLPGLSVDVIPAAKNIVVAGTIGKSALIDRLIENKKLNVKDISGKWDTYIIQVIEKPFTNVERALVIAGSNKRGTIYGMYDLSSQIGVSPWYWWADVPVKKHSNVYVSTSRYSQGEPKVKYRGIFLNDEAPALAGWAKEKFGGINHKFYENVFELILRLKGNYLWPAMWDNNFDDDDSLNQKLADEYGVVMGTSHHEPMMRAWKEWPKYGKGAWNYQTNESFLKDYWKKGIERMNSYESIVTLGMRGDGDEAMSASANTELLERIISDQRKILGEIKGQDITTVPQVWALYKEVQEYYDKGMRVPDDVTLLLCDDNWGNVRKLPKLGDPARKGGYGMYYHFDYVGGPRNYKWLNTNQIERTWEQMHLAYEYGVKQIWIVNVGDLKPMEFPISFFLDYAWNPEKITADRLHDYSKQWAENQFGAKYSNDIADIINKYTKYNSRRKPELLAPDTYSLINYKEAETVVSDYNELLKKAEKISNLLPKEYKDSFYQLVFHPVEACANLNELYVTVGKNHLFASQGRASTNNLAEKAKELYLKDSAITNYYNKVMAGGKWDHQMDQTHIGYTNWQQPDKNSMPAVNKIDLPSAPDMGVAIEGSDKWWPYEKSEAVLPEFGPGNNQSYYLDIFNRGKTPFEFSVKVDKPYILVSELKGKVETEKRLFIKIDWKKIPSGKQKVPIGIQGPNENVQVLVVVNNQTVLKDKNENCFIESNGYVSMEAENYTKAINAKPVTWLKIPNLGRTSSAFTIMPVTAASQTPGINGMRLEYKMYLFDEGNVNVKTYLSPTLNFGYTKGLRYAVSFDDEEPQIININAEDTIPDWRYPNYWNLAVSNNIRTVISKHIIKKPGEHILKFWAVDPGIDLQKIVVECAKVKPGYLGPPQSNNRALKSDK